jgi:beta-glucanase (GH16 family)
MVTSRPGFNFKFGYVEVQAHVPASPGLWSALWLAASNLTWPPEIDILESFGAPKNESAMFFHPVGAHYVGSRIPASYGATTGWHDFGMYWTSSEISWYYDGARMMTVTQRIPQQDMYILLNLATYSLNSSRSCSGTLEIRSVRVWQKA